MKQCSLFGAGAWPFIVFPLLLLLPLLFYEWHSIEEDVARNAQAELASIGAGWATAKTINRGRDVLIIGKPPSKTAIDVVREKAAGAKGVNSITVSSDVKPPELAAEFSANIKGSSIVLGGILANQADVSSIVAQAKDVFGNDNVTNRLSVNSNRAKLPQLDNFFKNLKDSSYTAEILSVSISGESLTLAGTIKNEQSKSLITQLASRLGLELNMESDFTIAPQHLDRYACLELVNELLASGEINFASSESGILEDSFEVLVSIKSAVLRCPNVSFEVAGHTDTIGGLDFNMTLSEQRAQAVIDHLTGIGLDISNFSAVGYGPNKPIADNASETGRAQNRRIEFKLKN